MSELYTLKELTELIHEHVGGMNKLDIIDLYNFLFCDEIEDEDVE